MKPFIKICGITNAADALLAYELGADALGFIFYEKSPRFIAPENARQIIAELPGKINTVGVFVNAGRDKVEEIIAQTGIDTIQLHGDESPDECVYDNIRVWKALRPIDDTDLAELDRYKVDAFLFDTYDRKVYGGTGRTGNWKFAQSAAKHHTIILSGGLNPDNILNAITTVHPYGIDINSGVESEPGKKDRRKLVALFNSISKID